MERLAKFVDPAAPTLLKQTRELLKTIDCLMLPGTTGASRGGHPQAPEKHSALRRRRRLSSGEALGLIEGAFVETARAPARLGISALRAPSMGSKVRDRGETLVQHAVLVARERRVRRLRQPSAVVLETGEQIRATVAPRHGNASVRP